MVARFGEQANGRKRGDAQGAVASSFVRARPCVRAASLATRAHAQRRRELRDVARTLRKDAAAAVSWSMESHAAARAERAAARAGAAEELHQHRARAPRTMRRGRSCNGFIEEGFARHRARRSRGRSRRAAARVVPPEKKQVAPSGVLGRLLWCRHRKMASVKRRRLWPRKMDFWGGASAP
jgi:hypothetical protein